MGSDSPPASPKVPSTPKTLQTINTEPSSKQIGFIPGDSSSPKELTFYLQNATNHPPFSGTPISAVFLAQFDVKSGYELKWFKRIDDSISLKGVEFKSLPSGLHEVDKAVVSFVQPQNFHQSDSPQQQNAFDNLLYGVSVYHSNSKDENQSRDTVRMFTLGILVDPLLQSPKFPALSKLTPPLSWKPIDYTKGLEYVDQLEKLLGQWDSSSNSYLDFEEFFDMHSNVNLTDQLLLRSPRTPRSLPRLTIDSTISHKHHSHHYLLKLPALLEHLGPLVFKVWRSTLLRERVLLFDAPSVELNCAFAYCLSIISAIPQDLVPDLTDTSSNIDTNLKFVQPIYSIGVNDIDWLKSLIINPSSSSSSNSAAAKYSFIAASTDEILLFKTSLYDIAVQFNSLPHSNSRIPKVLPAEASIPGSMVGPLKSTQRDLKRFKILTEVFELYPDKVEKKSCSNSDKFKWWVENTEPISWRQIAWSGFFWWASAGEKLRVDEEPEYENLNEIDGEMQGEIEKSLFIVGYFQSMIRRIFNTIIEAMKNEEASVNRNSETSLETPLIIENSDLFGMGLNPYSSQDKEFVIKLVKTWWGRDVKIGSSLHDLCCF